jgi:hypothetical protein
MDVNWWWKAFLMTFDRNHDQKCDKNLTMKTSCIRNLFYQDNGKFYCDVLRQLRENIRRKHPDKGRNNSRALNHDNALAHMLFVVQQFLASTHMTVIPHPLYSKDLTPRIFSYSQRWNWNSRGKILTAEIQTESQNMMKMLTWNDFQKHFWSWKSCWNRCIHAKGDYFEGDEGK